MQKKVLILLVLSLILWLIFLGNSPLRDWDEGVVAQVAREIWNAPPGTTHWLYPTLGGVPYQNKPPFIHLLIAWVYSLGGVNEWTTRLPSAVLTALGVPVLYLVGCLIFNQSLPALFSALVYMTMLPVVRHGRLAMLDGTITTFFLLLFFCFLKARKNRQYALGIGFCLGFIILVKGMTVLLLGGIVFLFLLTCKELALLRSPYLWIGMFLGNAPAIAWYAAQWQLYGQHFLQVHFHDQAFSRLVRPVDGNSGDFWFYLIEIVKYGFPWLLFWPKGFYLSWKKRHTTWGSLILISTIIYLLSISLMPTKLPWYVIPVYPFLALAIGVELSRIWDYGISKPKLLILLLVTTAIASLIGYFYVTVAKYQYILIIISLVTTITISIAIWLVRKQSHHFITILFCGTYLGLALLMSSGTWMWELNESFAVKPVAALIRAYLPLKTTIYSSLGYRHNVRPSLEFYCDCKIIPVPTPILQLMWSKKFYLLLDDTTLHERKWAESKVLGTAEGFTLIAPQ
ncbi:hypothetical protein NOS3756_10210 [Nostoc sp. NIES-3756]|uniref:ArnT family glycosyltransferase n=1 Tax=Nostoc sp. NIES-3756 TaxID=1751286 RepID=UPI0007229483|nr:glycosyltransferase family 39 protein [Nostoc sp. NIES-3756]BAT52090.1 hypothetical protein NOS3756_10210 [Nostoc sp. NIES-3756]